MITLNDWSDLITVNYKGGYCGDFFSILLYKNFNKDVPYLTDNNNRFYFEKQCVFETDLKSLLLIRMCHEGKRRELHYVMPGYHRRYFKLYDIYFNGSTDLAKDIREYLFDNFSHKFDGIKKIGIFHNHNNWKFSLQDIFPKSKNILLTCPPSFYNITRTLYFVKTLKDNYTRQESIAENFRLTKETKYDFYNVFFDESAYVKNANNEFEIDIFDLFFNDVNYDKKLSEYLQTDIVLDKEKIRAYKKFNIELLKKYDIDPYRSYDKKFFIDLAISSFSEIDRNKMKIREVI